MSQRTFLLALGLAAVCFGLYLWSNFSAFSAPKTKSTNSDTTVGSNSKTESAPGETDPMIASGSAAEPSLPATDPQSREAQTAAALANAAMDSPSDGLDARARAEIVARPLREFTPPLGELRAEVGRDPHNTPTALLKFSVALGVKTEHALESEEAARDLYRELNECLEGGVERNARSVQALCLRKAAELKDKHEALSGDYEVLRKKADPQAGELVDFLKR